MVKKNIPISGAEEIRARVAPALLALRATLGYSQGQMAVALQVSQGQVAKWEGQKQTPPGQAFAKIARLVPDEEKSFWLQLAGFTRAESEPSRETFRNVPLLKDSAAAGTPRAINETEIDRQVPFPPEWLPRGGKLYAVRVTGDSMAPILLDGHIVVIDVARRSPEKLVRKMVAARNEDGVTVKWLRHSGQIYSLVPQHVAPEYEVQYLEPHGDYSIVGEVVLWIGQPPPARK